MEGWISGIDDMIKETSTPTKENVKSKNNHWLKVFRYSESLKNPTENNGNGQEWRQYQLQGQENIWKKIIENSPNLKNKCLST